MYTLDDWVRHGDELRRPLLVGEGLAGSEALGIIGGGLSGLSLAYRIGTARPDLPIKLIEKTGRLGGVIETWRESKWVCDLSVNAVRPHPSFWRLVDDLDMGASFSPSRDSASSRWVILRSGKHRISPATIFKVGPLGFLRGALNSRKSDISVLDVIQNTEIADAMTFGIVNDTADQVDANFLFPSLTGFGPKPPISRRQLRKKISRSYPIFTPRRGSLASLEGGMEEIIRGLHNAISAMENIEIIMESGEGSPDDLSAMYDIPISSMIWASAPPGRKYGQTTLSIFVVGFPEEEVSGVEKGYGTLIPDSYSPISGILHESDIHSSARAPESHRLFRLMVPHTRWDANEQSVREALRELDGFSGEPAIFQKIGERKIPRYPPGYLSSLMDYKGDLSFSGWTGSGVSVTHVVDEAERISELFTQGRKD